MTAVLPPGTWHLTVTNDNGSLISLNATLPLMAVSSEAGNVTRYKRETPIYLAEGGVLDQIVPNEGDRATIDDFYRAYYPHLDAERQEALNQWPHDPALRDKMGSLVNRWPAYLARLGFLKKVNRRGEVWMYERTALRLSDLVKHSEIDSPERAWARRRIADLKAELSILERFLES